MEIQFNQLNFTNIKSTVINFQQKEIQVKQYLPILDKIDLVQIALQKAQEDGIYNDMKLEVFFHMNIIYLYTNIEFNEKDREDEFVLYDKFESSGLLDEIVAAIGGEYDTLYDYVTIMKKEKLDYSNTAAAVLRSIIQDLPKNAAAAAEIVNSFDPSQYQAVVDFATAANGGRNINTQRPPISPAANAEEQEEVSSEEKIVPITEVPKED